MTKKQRKEWKKQLRSPVGLAAATRSGAGAHSDRRLRRTTRGSWRREELG
jgi:hypothetical protein